MERTYRATFHVLIAAGIATPNALEACRVICLTMILMTAGFYLHEIFFPEMRRS